jgi:hypothetical protein
MKKDGPKAPTIVRGALGLKCYPIEETSAIDDCLENQFKSRDLCDENHKRLVKTKVQAVLEAVDNNRPPAIKDEGPVTYKLINSLKLRNIFGRLGRKQKKPGKNPKFPQTLRPISLLSTTCKLAERGILKTVQGRVGDKNLLHASHFGFRIRNRTTLQYRKLTNHVNLRLRYSW